MTSSGQAIRVVASGPMATTPPVSEYGPWYVLQPAEPETVAKRKTAVSSVPGSVADTVLGALSKESTTQDPRSGLSGGATNSSRTFRSAPRMVSVLLRMSNQRLACSAVRYAVSKVAVVSAQAMRVTAGTPTRSTRPLVR